MNFKNENISGTGKYPEWYKELKIFKKSSNVHASMQLANTILPYIFLWILMAYSVNSNYPYYLTLILSVPAAAFLVRIFILFHDCVHNSFMTSRKANIITGNILGLFVFTSFYDWRYSHLKHHSNYSNLDSRGYGDIWTITLEEYKSLNLFKRIKYRLYRSPAVFILLGGFYTFFIRNRYPGKKDKYKGKNGVYYTDFLILLISALLSWIIGLKTFLLIQIPVLWLAGMAGIWLFYVQHQFKGVYWARKKEIDAFKAAIEGCSFYKLPAPLRWVSGNIGYHHIHHLSPAIPNYLLKKCYEKVPQLQSIKPLSLLESIKCGRLKVWDEAKRELIRFPAVGV